MRGVPPQATEALFSTEAIQAVLASASQSTDLVLVVIPGFPGGAYSPPRRATHSWLLGRSAGCLSMRLAGAGSGYADVMRWTALDERNAHWWYSEHIMRQNHRVLADQTAVVMRDVALVRRELARTYDTLADRASGKRATHLRARARQFEELSDRALRFVEHERDIADG